MFRIRSGLCFAVLMSGVFLCAWPAVAQMDGMPTIPVTAPDVAALPVIPETKVKPFVPEGAAKEVAAINERLAVLSAQLAELEVQAKIAAKIAEINKLESGDMPVSSPSSSAPPPLNMGAMPSMSMSTRSNALFDSFGSVAIRDIEGVDGQMRATLILENGTRQVVRKGDKVGSMVITSISLDGVQAKDGKEMVNLPFYDNVSNDGKDDRNSRGSSL